MYACVACRFGRLHAPALTIEITRARVRADVRAAAAANPYKCVPLAPQSSCGWRRLATLACVHACMTRPCLAAIFMRTRLPQHKPTCNCMLACARVSLYLRRPAHLISRAHHDELISCMSSADPVIARAWLAGNLCYKHVEHFPARRACQLALRKTFATKAGLHG